MTNSKRPPKAEVDKYLNNAIKLLKDAPDRLERHEKRLLLKFSKVSEAAQTTLQDIQDLRNQIRQAEARLRSLELQAENHQGSANAYVDELVSMKWDLDVDEDPPTKPKAAPQNTAAPKSNRKPRAKKSSNKSKATSTN